MERAIHVAKRLAIAIGVATFWLAFFKLNGFVFSQFNHSARADWIFLPAALRIIAVLLFDNAGVVGLMVGAYFTLPHRSPSDIPHEVLLSISSGIAPLVAIWLCRRWFHIAYDLAGLRPLHIVLLSITGAAANSVILNGYLAVAGRMHGDAMQIVTVFVGDMLGTAIVLFVLSTILSLVMPRRRGAKPTRE